MLHLTLQKLGKYEIRGRIGGGAQAAVFRAWDPHLGKEVALKACAIDSVSSEQLDRLKMEARVVHDLTEKGTTQHIVKIWGVGEDSGVLYIVMELLNSGSLLDLLKEQRASQGIVRWSREEVADLVNQLAEGLTAAHENQIVHRDVKPANVLRSADGKFKLTDFGIARLQGDAAVRTLDGSSVGSPSYMSPEQCFTSAESPVDARADQYSLAVLAFELLTGHKPFSGSSPRELMDKIMDARCKPEHELPPDSPPELQDCIKRAMARDRELRYPTVAAFAAAFQTAVFGLCVDATNPAAGNSPTSPPKRATPLAPPHGRSAPTEGAGWRRYRMAASVALLVVAGATYAAIEYPTKDSKGDVDTARQDARLREVNGSQPANGDIEHSTPVITPSSPPASPSGNEHIEEPGDDPQEPKAPGGTVPDEPDLTPTNEPVVTPPEVEGPSTGGNDAVRGAGTIPISPPVPFKPEAWPNVSVGWVFDAPLYGPELDVVIPRIRVSLLDATRKNYESRTDESERIAFQEPERSARIDIAKEGKQEAFAQVRKLDLDLVCVVQFERLPDRDDTRHTRARGSVGKRAARLVVYFVTRDPDFVCEHVEHWTLTDEEYGLMDMGEAIPAAAEKVSREISGDLVQWIDGWRKKVVEEGLPLLIELRVDAQYADGGAMTKYFREQLVACSSFVADVSDVSPGEINTKSWKVRRRSTVQELAQHMELEVLNKYIASRPVNGLQEEPQVQPKTEPHKLTFIVGRPYPAIAPHD
jgi:serine/threonine protein kinase